MTILKSKFIFCLNFSELSIKPMKIGFLNFIKEIKCTFNLLRIRKFIYVALDFINCLPLAG